MVFAFRVNFYFEFIAVLKYPTVTEREHQSVGLLQLKFINLEFSQQRGFHLQSRKLETSSAIRSWKDVILRSSFFMWVEEKTLLSFCNLYFPPRRAAMLFTPIPSFCCISNRLDIRGCRLACCRHDLPEIFKSVCRHGSLSPQRGPCKGQGQGTRGCLL